MSYNPPTISEQAKKIAEKFFEHGSTVADTHNYDYAIELYIQGLAKNPEAVETGHKPLREISIKRKVAGGKKPGLIETIKRNTSNKDPIKAMLNAEYLLAKDPLNVAYIEALTKNADKAELPETLRWALEVFLELARQKPNANRLLAIKNYSEKLGDYYEKIDKPDIAIECYQRGLDALEVGIQAGFGEKYDFVSIQRNLAGKLTILRGKYERAEDFRASVKDADAQKELQDKAKIVKGEELLGEMIEKARAELERNPDVTGKINALIDLLLQRGRPEDEQEAIEILENAYNRSKQYNYKMRADDVRIRQLSREVRKLKEALEKNPEDEQLKAQFKQASKKLEEFELDVFAERVKQYPTDNKLKFEYGKRLFKAKKFDEAIPMFQEASSDPRFAVRAKYYIGACFYQKGWYQQAIDILQEAIASYETTGDSVSKEMHYILGRALEDSGQTEQALKIYSKLIQWDYNYRDVKARIDALQQKK